jgi:hypothetical protein
MVFSPTENFRSRFTNPAALSAAARKVRQQSATRRDFLNVASTHVCAQQNHMRAAVLA